ncbi:MAG: tRNA lysidine(34) synthetase TilS [Muribaculaceae bacterium]|nr:tRNA lysidine(34) synthetase TilS [Muribaculaceae bacterium]
MRHRLTDYVAETIARHGLLRPDGRVVVALSGGADSVALLAVLLELGYDCVAAHCNFHLRGEESLRDMRHAEAVTERLEVDMYVKDFDVETRCSATGESVEMACRELRYSWFRELLERDCAQAIAVGHHREDQIETFFLNLLRGSGPTGLGGMRYRNRHVVRPLLDVSRADIEDYLNSRGLRWVDDSTNALDDFTRNRIRHHLSGPLEDLFPGATAMTLRSMNYQRETADAYARAVALVMKRFTTPTPGEYNLRALLDAEPANAAAWLFEALRGEGFDRRRTDDMLRAAERDGGTFRGGNGSHVREVDHGILRAPHAAAPAAQDTYDVSLACDIFEPVNIRVSRHHVSEFAPVRDPHTAYIDAAALGAGHLWQLRRWHRGDRMQPYGMNDSKLLSDIFADARLSAEAKRNLWLLTCDGRIVWAVGLRASSMHVVGPRTKTYLRLEFIPSVTTQK